MSCFSGSERLAWRLQATSTRSDLGTIVPVGEVEFLSSDNAQYSLQENELETLKVGECFGDAGGGRSVVEVAPVALMSVTFVSTDNLDCILEPFMAAVVTARPPSRHGIG